MLNYTVHQLHDILNAKLFGSNEGVITSVSIDSRSVSVGEGSLFFAIVGSNHDGHRFIGELYARGVRCFVVSSLSDFPNQYPEGTFLLVENTLLALHKFSEFHRKQFAYPVIGITGSNGKTIVKEWLSQLLSTDKKVIRSPKSFNSQVGVPLSVLQMDTGFDLAIFEAGISLPGEMESLQRIIAPEIGIFTNLGAAHQENFASIEQKGLEKVKLFSSVKTLIYCKDFDTIDLLSIELSQRRNVKLFTWGRSSKADIQVKDIKVNGSKTTICSSYIDQDFDVTIPFSDSASIENAMHCLAALIHLGVSNKTICERMTNLQPVAMRLELKEGINGCTVINDSYNSDLGSLSVALDFLSRQKQHPRKMLIISDILQSGIDSESLYSDVAKLVASKGVDKIIGIGTAIKMFSSLFGKNSSFYDDTQAFLKDFSRSSVANTAILLKGSRQFQFEKISSILEQKTHRTLLEINLNALVHNLNFFRGLLKPGVKTMVMVKAFAYGSGSHEIASLLQFHRVDYLGVAFTDEGIALREAGITLPIIVLNPNYGSHELMIEYNLEPEIYSFSSLENFAAVAARMGVNSYPIHIKIDTGMHRLGFGLESVDSLLFNLKKTSSVRVKSILSHLVATDDPNHDEFTNYQIDEFESVCSMLSSSLGYKPMMHILNSAGIERFSRAQFDMVRLGIGLYGVSTVYGDKLQNVSTLKTYVAQLHCLDSGETVGYNRAGKVIRKSIIATLPVGYADGLNRKLSNGVGSVMVNNQLAPTIGNISMDTCMVDVTNIPNVKEGDEVIVFGQKPSISDIADALGTIPYEILTSISRRVNRVYLQE